MGRFLGWQSSRWRSRAGAGHSDETSVADDHRNVIAGGGILESSWDVSLPSLASQRSFVERNIRGNLALSSGHAATRWRTLAGGMQVADLL
jgi:hypothetical protein